MFGFIDMVYRIPDLQPRHICFSMDYMIENSATKCVIYQLFW
jgi:hypothetical protein